MHQTYNDAIAFKSVSGYEDTYMEVYSNVVYDVEGHGIVLEDGVEKYFDIEDNLVAKTKSAFHHDKSAITPAGFLVRHPYVDFEYNYAVDSEGYGMWFNYLDHPTGKSFTPDMCPGSAEQDYMGYNLAHSNGLDGLRLYPQHTPH